MTFVQSTLCNLHFIYEHASDMTYPDVTTGEAENGGSASVGGRVYTIDDISEARFRDLVDGAISRQVEPEKQQRVRSAVLNSAETSGTTNGLAKEGLSHTTVPYSTVDAPVVVGVSTIGGHAGYGRAAPYAPAPVPTSNGGLSSGAVSHSTAGTPVITGVNAAGGHGGRRLTEPYIPAFSSGGLISDTVSHTYSQPSPMTSHTSTVNAHGLVYAPPVYPVRLP